MSDEREWLVTHTVTQTVPAKTAEEAERIARYALEGAHSEGALWWPSVAEGADVQVGP